MTLCFAKRFIIALIALGVLSISSSSRANDIADLQREFEELRRENKALREKVDRQEKMIESLNERLTDVQSAQTNAVSESQVARD